MTPSTACATTDRDLADVIGSGAVGLGLDLDATQIDRLVAYLRLVERWNATYNLTAVRTIGAMATQHIVDSLSIIPTLRALSTPGSDPARILDVGSGAGLPGAVIAIVDARSQVLCIDSVGKKAAFVTQVAGALGLARLSALHARVESLQPPPQFDVVVSRAFASLADFVGATRHLPRPGGRWIAMKGKLTQDEIDAVDPEAAVFETHRLHVPGLDADRCLAIGRHPPESERPL